MEKNKETKYRRPCTRGALRDCLRSGITCEVVTSVVESTVLLLQGWLTFKDFTVCPSENEGWSLFVPHVGGEKEQNEDSDGTS